MMAFFTIEDLTGVVEATLLPEAYERCGAVLAEQEIVALRGRPESDDRWREDREGPAGQRLLAEAVCRLGDEEGVRNLRSAGGRNGRRAQNGWNGREGRARRPAARPANPRPAAAGAPQPTTKAGERLHIRVPRENAEDAMGRLRDLISQCYGDTEVLLHIEMGERERRVRLGRDFLVRRDEQFTRAVTDLLGDGAVWLE
jgi:hypothetical protein